MEGLKILKG